MQNLSKSQISLSEEQPSSLCAYTVHMMPSMTKNETYDTTPTVIKAMNAVDPTKSESEGKGRERDL